MTRTALDAVCELDALVTRLERRDFRPATESPPPARNVAQAVERGREKQGSAKGASHRVALRMFNERRHKPS